VVVARSLTKTLGSTPVLGGVSFELPERGVTGLLGPNGAGKTTTIRILTTLLAPGSGHATIGGFDTVEDAAKVRGLVGYLPEVPPLYAELRVSEYLRIVGGMYGMKGAALQAGLESALARCQLTDVSNKIIAHLSKGYKQRVGIAQALIHRPPVIILDEPTSGLDPMQLLQTRELIRELGKEHTVLFSSHILQEVIETCSRVLLLVGGVVRFDGSTAEMADVRELEARFIEGVRNP